MISAHHIFMFFVPFNAKLINKIEVATTMEVGNTGIYHLKCNGMIKTAHRFL